MTIKIGIDKVSLQHGKLVIARGEHKKPISEQNCDNCKYADLQADEIPCNDCKWDGEKITHWEAKS